MRGRDVAAARDIIDGFATGPDPPMATLHSLPAVRVAAPDPLTPARHRLRQTIAAVDRVSRETKAAAEQLHRLTE